MRYPRKWQLAVVCLLALALIPFAPAPRGTAQAPGYTVTDLGTLGGAGLESRAFGLDECGNVVGESQGAAGALTSYHPFYWDGETMTDLGTLGGSTGVATALNQSGTVVGSSLTSGSLLRPFVRPSGGPMINLGSLGGFSAEAQDINASGQVVGQSEDGSLQDRAFIWQDSNNNGSSDPGEMRALTAPWGTPIRAYGINDAGQVAGSANLSSSGTHAFVTVGGVAVDLGTLGGAVSVATDVNDLGEVSGYSYIFSNTITQSFHAFRWKDADGDNQSDPGEMLDLGVLGGDRNSYAYDLNASGQVVGYSENGLSGGNNVTRAFIWTSANGMQNLNDVVPGTGWTFREARAVNNRGQIVGTGLNPDGKVHAFLLTPTNVGPSPCDPTPTPTPAPNPLQFTAATYAVGEGGGSAVISVSRTGSTENTVTVNYATSDGTAAQPSDYASASGTLTFGPGETEKTFSVTVNDDTLDEPDETVNLTLSSPGPGAVLGTQSTATLTINDNDSQPTLQFSSATYTVGEGSATATITVTRAGGTNGGVTVNYATSDATAVAGSDYTATNGTLTFAEGDNSETFTVAINGDALDEPNEGLNLTLSSPLGGALGAQTTAVLHITDDDATPTLSISDVTVTEGNTGMSPATNATFVVTLTGASAQPVTVSYNTADGSATQPGDYHPKGGTVTYNPGETGTRNIDIEVVGDTADEPNETFNLNLSTPTNATINDGTGVGTITDDDGAPALNISDVSVIEGNAGTTAATFTVSLLPASGQTVTVNYAAADGTATTGGGDYAAASGTLTFVPGDTSETVTVNVTGETAAEAHENFVVNLSSPSNAGLGDSQGQGTIRNDDTSLSINDLLDNGINEGNNSVGTSFVFTVSLSHVSALPVSFNYATANDTATAPHDFIGARATLEIPAGSTSASIAVLVVGDNTFENNEEFAVNLSSAVNAVIADAQGRARILNDEAASLFQISGGPNQISGGSNFSISEGGGTATFTITRTGSTAGGVTVNYATSNGTATAGSDYTAASGPITFAEGDMSETFEVSILNDTLDEPDETVIVSLTPGFGASPGTASSVSLKIADDDAPPTFQFTNSVYGLPENGLPENRTGSITITVTRDGGTNAASVNYATSNGTATEGSDYTPASGTLIFAADEVVKTFNINITNDTLDETDETVNLALSSPGGGAVLGSPNTATLTITDDDDPPTVSIGGVTVTEGSAGATNAVFSVTLSGASGKAVSVNYATADVTASAGFDYTADSGTVTFNPGETSTKNVSIAVLGDTLDEPEETFNVALSSPSNATLNGGTGVGTIKDDDAAPTLSVNDVTVAEGTAATTNATFTVSLSAASGQTVTV
ncbi:MAG TPA: Calx-beta domain-containing protein, partial [Pyrinomonadaceae bacterium]